MRLCNSWQKLHSRAFDQFLVADRWSGDLAFAVGLPMRPGPLGRRVVYQLVEVHWHAHPVIPNAGAALGKHGTRENEHIPLGPLHIVPGVLLDLVPAPPRCVGRFGEPCSPD